LRAQRKLGRLRYLKEQSGRPIGVETAWSLPGECSPDGHSARFHIKCLGWGLKILWRQDRRYVFFWATNFLREEDRRSSNPRPSVRDWRSTM